MEMKRIQIFRNVKKCIKIFEFLKSKAMHHKIIAIKVLDRFNKMSYSRLWIDISPNSQI